MSILRAASAAAFGLWLLLLLTACLPHPSRPYYLSVPITADSISVYIDERTLVWLNSYLKLARSRLQEDATCLHVEKSVGDSVFYVDSMELGGKFNDYPDWAHVRAMCPPETAPLHWHVVTPELGGWLRSQGDTEDFIVKHRCEFSDPDQSAIMSRYPFVAMQCGNGKDSIFVRRIRRRHAQ